MVASAASSSVNVARAVSGTRPLGFTSKVTSDITGDVRSPHPATHGRAPIITQHKGRFIWCIDSSQCAKVAPQISLYRSAAVSESGGSRKREPVLWDAKRSKHLVGILDLFGFP